MLPWCLFTDSDTGIYSKGVRNMRAFCVIVVLPATICPFRIFILNVRSERPSFRVFLSRKSRCTLLFFFSFSPFLFVFSIGIVFTLTARRSADTHQSLSLETPSRIMNTFSSNAPKLLSPGCSTPHHVPRQEENTSTIPSHSPKNGGGMSARRALELIKRMPKPEYTG